MFICVRYVRVVTAGTDVTHVVVLRLRFNQLLAAILRGPGLTDMLAPGTMTHLTVYVIEFWSLNHVQKTTFLAESV